MIRNARAGTGWGGLTVRYSVHPGPAGLQRIFEDSFENIFRARAAEVFLKVWPDLRACARPACNVTFLPFKTRQKYCSARCRAQTIWVRYAANHADRPRDYRAEYAQRVRRLTGGARVKIRRVTRHRPRSQTLV